MSAFSPVYRSFWREAPPPQSYRAVQIYTWRGCWQSLARVREKNAPSKWIYLPGFCLCACGHKPEPAPSAFRPVGENTSGPDRFSVNALVFQAVMVQSRKLTWLHFQETRFGGNWCIHFRLILYTVTIFCHIMLVERDKTLGCTRTIPKGILELKKLKKREWELLVWKSNNKNKNKTKKRCKDG